MKKIWHKKSFLAPNKWGYLVGFRSGGGVLCGGLRTCKVVNQKILLKNTKAYFLIVQNNCVLAFKICSLMINF